MNPKLPSGTGGDVRIKAKIPVVSDEYQTYLEALKERERLREANGGDTVEGVKIVREAAQNVDKLAKKIISTERGN